MNNETFLQILRIKIHADLVHQDTYICKECDFIAGYREVMHWPKFN